MKKLMKLLVSILLNMVLLHALVQAPSSHVHAHEATQRHVASFLHTHVSHKHAPISDHRQWRELDPDDDAQFLTWAPMVPNGGEGLGPVTLVPFHVAPQVPVVSRRQTTTLRPSAHDPPILAALSPRAPPL